MAGWQGKVGVMAHTHVVARMDVDGSLRFVRWASNITDALCAVKAFEDHTIPHPKTGVPMNAVACFGVKPTEDAEYAQDDIIGYWDHSKAPHTEEWALAFEE